MHNSNTQKINKRKKSSAVKSRPKEGNGGVSSLLQNALFGSFVGLLCALILLLAGAAIAIKSDDPDAVISPISLFALYASAFFGGFLALRKNRSSALLCGSLCGVFLLIFFLVLSFFLRGYTDSHFSSAIAWLLRIAMLPVSAAGGFLGMSQKRKKSKRRHS